MHRGMVCLLWSSVALAQVPQREPLDAAIQAYWDARKEARFEAATAKRDEARRLLEGMPVDSPQFGPWVQNVAQLYESAGMTAQARAILQEGLSRAGALGESHPTRIMLLTRMADLWQQDRNLLKSLAYLEKAAAAVEAAPPAKSPAPRAVGQVYPARRFGSFSSFQLGLAQDNSYVYQRLADLYQQLGRPEAVAAVLTKMRTLAKNNDAALATLYERQGELDEAAAIYKRQAEQAAMNPQSNPWQLSGPLQSLASLYQREQRYADAAAALQQAIAALEASGKPDAHNQTIWLRQNLASILNQAGQTEAADQIYQQLVAETSAGPDSLHLQVLTSYASYLSMTKRGAQGEDLLEAYLANHPNLQPAEEAGLLFSLANAARNSGQPKRGDEYQRAAMEKQQAAQMAPPGQIFIASHLQRAQSAANEGDLDAAFSLTLQALDTASRAVDRDQVAWTVPSIAAALASKKAPDKAEQLYQRLFGVVQSWSADTLQPLLNVLQNYPRFLMQQRRWDEVPAAIERYRDALTTARGAETGWLEDVLRLTIEFERARGSWEKALPAAQDLLALEESLSGTSSEPYLRAAETLAEFYESGGDPGRALPLRLQTVAIADVVFPVNDARRGFTRINAAFALARQRQFDEAERLANEAVAIGQLMRPSQPNLFIPQLEQIRRMKAAPQTGTIRSIKWFDTRTLVAGPNTAPSAGTAGATMAAVPGATPVALPPPPPSPSKQR